MVHTTTIPNIPTAQQNRRVPTPRCINPPPQSPATGNRHPDRADVAQLAVHIAGRETSDKLPDPAAQPVRGEYKTTTKLVIITRVVATLEAGASKTVTLKLDRAGMTLLFQNPSPRRDGE